MYPNAVLLTMAHIKMSDYWTAFINLTPRCSPIYIHMLIHCQMSEIQFTYVLLFYRLRLLLSSSRGIRDNKMRERLMTAEDFLSIDSASRIARNCETVALSLI